MKTRTQVLVVDDNIVMLKFLTNLLSEKYQVVCKLNAFDALKWLEEGNHPSIIISDLLTPGMENLAFVKNLKVSGFYRNTPMILLSEILQSSQSSRDLAATVDAYFPKPFNPVQLQDTIGDLLTKYHAAA